MENCGVSGKLKKSAGFLGKDLQHVQRMRRPAEPGVSAWVSFEIGWLGD
jgi:hypothetical protein